MKRVLCAWWIGLVIALVATGQDVPGSGAYRIGPKDVIQIEVFELPELNGQFRVSESNTVTLPLIGDIRVGGLTEEELQARLKGLLESRYVQRAIVTVRLEEYRSKPINVIGAVQRPGPLKVSGKLTLIEVLTAAGGLTGSHGDTIYVMRRAENGLRDQVEISVEDLLVRADPQLNIPIFANDLINVPDPVDVTIFFLGEVKSPGAHVFQSTERITILAAIAKAGGFTDRASRKIVVKRQTSAGGEEEIAVDYKHILAGRDPDVELQPGDVVFVKQSFL